MIVVTYNIAQDFNNTIGMKEILRDLKTWGATTVFPYPTNYHFECIKISEEALKIYCELKNLVYWDLVFNVINLCLLSIPNEIKQYGKDISNIEFVPCIIEADKEIRNYQVPDEIHKGETTDEQGNIVSNNNTFEEQFHVEQLENNRVKMSIVITNKYPTKAQLFAIKEFSDDNVNLNINFI